MCCFGIISMCNFALTHFCFILQFLHEKVQSLDLSECTVSDVGIDFISKCDNLKKLDLNSAKESRIEVSSEGLYRGDNLQ